MIHLNSFSARTIARHYPNQILSGALSIQMINQIRTQSTRASVNLVNYYNFGNFKTINYFFPLQSKDTNTFTKHALILQANHDWNGAFQPAEKKCEELSTILAMGEFSTKIIYFSSASDLEAQLILLAKKIDFVWLRAHGSVHYFECGDPAKMGDDERCGNEITLSPLFPLLTEKPVLVLESCLTGLGLAGKLKNKISQLNKYPTVIAPTEASSSIGIDVAALVRKGEIEVIMHDVDWRRCEVVLKDSQDKG